MDARVQELVTAAKDGVLFIAEVAKAIGKEPSTSPTLVRLLKAIDAVESTPASPGGGRMDVEVDTDA